MSEQYGLLTPGIGDDAEEGTVQSCRLLSSIFAYVTHRNDLHLNLSPPWRLIMASIFRHKNPDASIFSDVSFALSPEDVLTTRMAGEATLLVLTPVQTADAADDEITVTGDQTSSKCEPPKTLNDSTQPVHSGITQLEPSNTIDDMLPCTPYVNMSAAQLQTHLLANPFHPVPLIPILCVADDNNITPLLRSAVAQKHALGHRLPIVGVRFPSSGPPICQVLLAWSDSSTDEEMHMETGAPCLSGPGSGGVFDLERPEEALAFMRFLQSVSINASRQTYPAWTAPKPGFFWRTAGIMTVAHWRDRILEHSDAELYHDATTADGTHRCLTPYLWSSPAAEWTLDKPLYDMSDCMIHETRERQKKKAMKMKDPGVFELTVGQWSTDHHVLTLSLLRKGPAHRRHVQMLNRYYRLMYPKKITEQRISETRLTLGVGPDLVSAAAEELGHDPRHHLMVEALSTLAREDVWQKPTRDSDRILEMWDHAMGWCVEVMSSEPSLASPLHYLPTILINHLRCKEYDFVKLSTGGPVPMPHARFSELTRGHFILMQREYMAINLQLLNTNWHSKEGPPLRQAEREISEASKHASRMEGDIEYILDVLTDTVTPRSKRWSAQYAAKTEARKLRSRLQRYPLGGFADAGLTIIVDDILNNLESDMSPPEVRAFLQDISCMSPRSSIKDPSGSALPTLADPESHVLHLPILLVWHQIHDCGLDDLTRNRQRLNCVSAVQFLATLGIKDFPVYGLATSGQYGYVSSTWFSSADNCIYTADRSTAYHRFDLCADGMVRFVDFLWGLRQHAEELKARFNGIREQLVERMRTEDGRASLRWTLRSQLDEYNMWPGTGVDDEEVQCDKERKRKRDGESGSEESGSKESGSEESGSEESDWEESEEEESEEEESEEEEEIGTEEVNGTGEESGTGEEGETEEIEADEASAHEASDSESS